MNDKKVAFLICTNDEIFLEECRYYLRRLDVPTGYEIEIITKTGAASMCAGYNEMMRMSDAKYKVYMHQDVFILNKNFISDILDIFRADSSIGMIGMVGYRTVPDTGVMWKSPERVGAVPMYGACEQYKDTDFSSYTYSVCADGYEEVKLVDGFLMATSIDLEWDEQTFDGWDFYDADHSLDFIMSDYKVVVPRQKVCWCVHDDGSDLTLWNYNKYRIRFLNKYEMCGDKLHFVSYPENSDIPIVDKLMMHEQKKEINSELLTQMVSCFDTAIVNSDSGQISKILECVKHKDFILAGASSLIIRMLSTFGKLGEVHNLEELRAVYRILIFSLRRIETNEDITLFAELKTTGITPEAVLSVLDAEYFEKRKFICEYICGSESLFGNNVVDKLTWFMKLGEKYPTEFICTETASLLMDYNEFCQALIWLKKIQNPSEEMKAIIDELQKTVG